MPQSLVILNGRCPGTSQPLVPGTDVTIGRHPSRDLHVDDERASRMHARVVFHNGRWLIEDCGSLNGTQVNLEPVQKAVLEPGDLIRIGERVILFSDYATDHSDQTPSASPTSRMQAVRRRTRPRNDSTVQLDPLQALQQECPIAGSSPAIRHVLDQIARVGPTDSNVLILGESGTGKELAARVVHQLSPRHGHPYVTVNCASISESLLESELFGHEQGSFTGADRRHEGQFERAHGGTLFLDEAGEMSLSCQAKLLRVLEGHSFARVGGREAIRVDVRVVAATHRDLEALVAEGGLRQDLYYRLRVIDLRLPPLRERGDDVLQLAERFLSAFCRELKQPPRRFAPDALTAIRRHRWPGNVRELKNAVERAVVLGRSAVISAADLGLVDGEESGLEPESLRAAEVRHIRQVLARVGGNKSLACRILGIGRGTLYKKLAQQDEAL